MPRTDFVPIRCTSSTREMQSKEAYSRTGVLQQSSRWNCLPSSKTSLPQRFTMTDDIRNRSVKLLETSLAASGSSDVSQLASSLEEAIFQANGSSTGNEYRDAVRQRSLILKKDNPELATSLMEGNISVEEVAGATSQVSLAHPNVPL